MSQMQAVKNYKMFINHNYCKFATCEICIGLCPVKNLVIRGNRVTSQGECKGCKLCERYCPDMAIKIDVE